MHYIRHVYVVTDYDPSQRIDLTNYIEEEGDYHKGLRIINSDDKYLRRRIIEENCFIKPGEKYNSADVDRTYQSFGRLGILKFININFHFF